MDRRKITRVLAVLAASAVLLFGFLVAQRLADYYKDSDVVQTSQEDSFYVGDLTLELTTRGGYPVYYSTDGSVPSTENSALYSGPLARTVTERIIRLLVSGENCSPVLIFMQRMNRH